MSLIPSLPSSHSRSLAAVGLAQDLPPIRRTVEGTIDYDWYLGSARRARADAYRSLFRAIGAAFAAWKKSIRDRRARKRALAELLGLDDRTLRDMGVNRAGVYFAVDHGREDTPTPANANESPSRSPRVA